MDMRQTIHCHADDLVVDHHNVILHDCLRCQMCADALRGHECTATCMMLLCVLTVKTCLAREMLRPCTASSYFAREQRRRC